MRGWPRSRSFAARTPDRPPSLCCGIPSPSRFWSSRFHLLRQRAARVVISNVSPKKVMAIREDCVKPAVTVLMDTYNHERFIEEAIVSVLEQDFPRGDVEILIVDDGSTDRTLKSSPSSNLTCASSANRTAARPLHSMPEFPKPAVK